MSFQRLQETLGYISVCWGGGHFGSLFRDPQTTYWLENSMCFGKSFLCPTCVPQPSLRTARVQPGPPGATRSQARSHEGGAPL